MTDAEANRIKAALDRLKAGDWGAAHGIVQDMDGPEAAWVHAHLHRVEGDLANAGYWYERAGRQAFGGDLVSELAALDAAFR